MRFYHGKFIAPYYIILTIYLHYFDTLKNGFILKVTMFLTYWLIVKNEYCYVAITTSKCRIRNGTIPNWRMFFQVSHY